MQKFTLLIAFIGFIMCLLSMYILRAILSELLSGSIGLAGLLLCLIAIYLMKK
jgi:hypothetical protein